MNALQTIEGRRPSAPAGLDGWEAVALGRRIPLIPGHMGKREPDRSSARRNSTASYFWVKSPSAPLNDAGLGDGASPGNVARIISLARCAVANRCPTRIHQGQSRKEILRDNFPLSAQLSFRKFETRWKFGIGNDGALLGSTTLNAWSCGAAKRNDWCSHMRSAKHPDIQIGLTHDFLTDRMAGSRFARALRTSSQSVIGIDTVL